MRPDRWWYTVPLRLRSLFRRQQVEQELDDELRYHLEQNIAMYVAEGLPAEEARYAALRDMGGIEQRKEECRDARRVNTLDHLRQDLRYAVRMLAKAPGSSAAAVIVLALGIGANTAIFSVVNRVLLEPLGYPESQRLVQLMLNSPSWAIGQKANIASVPEFILWREQNTVFERVAAYDLGTAVSLTGGNRAEQVRAMHVSAEYFVLFGGRIQIGRSFTEEEDRPGGRRVLLISHALWQTRFGSDPKIAGSTLVVGSEPWEIVGVLAPQFSPDIAADIWQPLQADPVSRNPGHNIRVAALLRPGATIAMANAQLEIAYQEFRRRFPAWFVTARQTEETFVAAPIIDVLLGNVRPALHLLLGAVLFVLLIACANVAHLLLARAVARRREMAVRSALGASTKRLLTQALTESVLLSVAGGLLGLALGYAGVRLLMLLNPGNIPRIGSQGSGVALDWRVLTFTALVSIVTGIACGLLPALSGARTEVSAVFNETGVRSGRSLRHKRIHAMLVVSEIGLAFMLLVGASLLMRSFRTLQAVDTGFNPTNILTMEMSLVGTRFQTASELAELVRKVERRVEELPGVIAVAATFSLPLEHKFGGPITVDGRPDDVYGSDACFVSRRYFDVFGIPVLRGRAFSERDDENAQSIVLINRMIAEGLRGTFQWSTNLSWPGGEAVGQRITMGLTMGPIADRTREIIGVVGDVRDVSVMAAPQPNIYVPIAQMTENRTRQVILKSPLAWVIRTQTTPYSLRSQIEEELTLASGGLPVANVRSMEQVMAASTARTTFNTILLGSFAVVALALAASGIYSLLAFGVQQRKHEIGIRMAVGASPAAVRALIFRQGVLLAILGMGLGVIGSLTLTEFIQGLLYEVEASDPMVFLAVAAMVTAVVVVAVYLPARRATLVNPVIALRAE